MVDEPQSEPPPKRWRKVAVIVPGVVGLIALFFTGPFPQDPGYHDFADTRVLLGIPHFGDVVSNLAFVLAGLHGLFVTLSQRGLDGRSPFVATSERWAYLCLFAGVALAGFGSAYYHYEPDNASLFWDRLPMTIAFASMFSILLGERVSVQVGKWSLMPALALGVASVVYWHLSEQGGHGDIRFYGLVQFYPLVAGVLLLALFRPRYTQGHHFWALFAAYGAAKVFEEADAVIFELNGFVSGHSLKHVFAALGVWALVAMLRKRRPRRVDSRGGKAFPIG